MGVFSLKWLSLSFALLLLQWGIPCVDAQEDNMYGEDLLQQQGQSCDPQRLSLCRDYLERRRDQPSERCCEEVQRLSPQCRCRAIQQILDQLSSYDSSAPLNQRRSRRHGEGRGREEEQEEEEEEMEERAADLPNSCNVRQPPRRCNIQRHSRYFMRGSSF